MKQDTTRKRSNHDSEIASQPIDNGLPGTKQPRKTSLSKGHRILARNARTTSQMSLDLLSLVDIAHQIGTGKRRECPRFSQGICRLFRWPSWEEVPQAAGKPVRDTKSEPCWRVKPTIPFCGFCPESWYLLEVYADLSEEETHAGGGPFSGHETP